MIVDCAVYERGLRLGGDLGLQPAYARARDHDDAFVWIGLHEPTEDEFESVRREFDLHELAVEDAIKAHQRPKLERYGDTLFLVLKTARYLDEEESVEFGELLLFVGSHFIVIVRHGGATALSDVRASLEADVERMRLGPAAVLHAVLDRVVDDYAPVVAGISVDIDEVEEQVFSIERANPTERIYKLKREVIEFHRATQPLLEPLKRLSAGEVSGVPGVPGEVTEYLRDVHDHLLRVNEQVDGFRDLLNSVLDANLAQVGVRQNEDMRKISAWVAIAAVPTMIAGIYGMNFEHMPELDERWAYPAVLALMVSACTGLFTFFRRRGWL